MASAAILTGGNARRYHGMDKAALTVAGQSILARQLHELSQVTDDILIVGRRDASPPVSGVRMIPDRVADAGPLAGLDAALAAARDDVLVVLGCDMPCVTAAFIAHLVQLAGKDGAVVPRSERGYHPLCAVYTRACHSTVKRRLHERQLKMLDLLEDLPVRAVDVKEMARFGDPRRLLANVNAPDELDELEALLGHKV